MGNIESVVHSPEDYVNYHVSHGEHSSCLSKLHLSHRHQEQSFQMSQQHPAHITDNFSSLDQVLNLAMKFVEVICLLMYHPWCELYTLYKCVELYRCASFINYNGANCKSFSLWDTIYFFPSLCIMQNKSDFMPNLSH